MRRRESHACDRAHPTTAVGSGTTDPSAGDACTKPKFIASAVKSCVLVLPSKLKSPSLQSLSDATPKLVATALKSRAFTTPSIFASPTYVYRTSSEVVSTDCPPKL